MPLRRPTRRIHPALTHTPIPDGNGVDYEGEMADVRSLFSGQRTPVLAEDDDPQATEMIWCNCNS